MSFKNVEVLRSAHENWNRRNFDASTRDLAENCSYADHARGEMMHGKRRFREYLESWARAWPDGKITNARYMDVGDAVIAEYISTGTNDGSLAGLPPTGRSVAFRFCEIWQFDKNGYMTSGRCYYDLYSILTQLGHLKPLAMAA
jgi:steroid delta-isomerase-like uncharacterized protein